MDNKKINQKPEEPEVERVQWFGMDGLLCLLYAVLGCIYSYGIINRIDWIVGIMAPGTAVLITVSVFLRYCFEVGSFTKKANKNKK